MSFVPIEWEITEDFRGDEDQPITASLKSDCGFYEIFSKWDGCTEIRNFNGIDEDGSPIDEDYHIHVCDFLRFAKNINNLADKLKDHFNNGEWEL